MVERAIKGMERNLPASHEWPIVRLRTKCPGMTSTCVVFFPFGTEYRVIWAIREQLSLGIRKGRVVYVGGETSFTLPPTKPEAHFSLSEIRKSGEGNVWWFAHPSQGGVASRLVLGE